MLSRLIIVVSLLLLGLGPQFGCSNVQHSKSLTLATTTSTRDSGLLDRLLPDFEQQTGIEVKVVAVGTGRALELGRRGDADVLLTHAPAAEQKMLQDGYAAEARRVMYNDFVIVGPASDPAEIKGESSAAAALQKIAQAHAPFVSRGDNSGTHMKEQALWRAAGAAPAGSWCLESGAGMAEVLRLASQKRAYTLTDRGTFLSQRSTLELEILYQGDAALHNVYSVLLLSEDKHPQLNHAGARSLAEFLLREETQKKIGRFGVERYGQPLFFPIQDDRGPS